MTIEIVRYSKVFERADFACGKPELDILPLPRGGENRLHKGLLLRSDVHTLFDRGYLDVDLQHRLQVSLRLRAELENGNEFQRSRSQAPIEMPHRKADRPNREFLEWHMDEVFLASRGADALAGSRRESRQDGHGSRNVCADARRG